MSEDKKREKREKLDKERREELKRKRREREISERGNSDYRRSDDV